MQNADDERSIIAVLTRYATGIDKRDWPLLRSCFSDDFSGDYGDFGIWNSAGEITAFMEQAHANVGPTLHRLSNFAITVKGDMATSRTYVDALLMPATPADVVHQASGYYDDELARAADGWKITRRSFIMVRMI